MVFTELLANLSGVPGLATDYCEDMGWLLAATGAAIVLLASTGLLFNTGWIVLLGSRLWLPDFAGEPRRAAVAAFAPAYMVCFAGEAAPGGLMG